MSSEKRASVSWSVTSVAMPHSLTSPSVTILSAVAVCRENRPSRLRSRDLVESTIMPSHSLSPCSTSRPSAITGSIGLMRGNPSLRRVASIINPVAASRLSASAASSGASPENSVQVAMGAPYDRDMTRFVDRLGRPPDPTATWEETLPINADFDAPWVAAAAGVSGRIGFAVGDVGAPCLPPGSAELVWASGVVHHLADQQAGGWTGS